MLPYWPARCRLSPAAAITSPLLAGRIRPKGCVIRNDGEFMPGLELPPAFYAVAHKYLTDVKVTSSAANWLTVQVRAEGLK